MSWRPKAETAHYEPIAGVEWREYTDQEFAALSARYDEQFPDQKGSLERWFEETKKKRAPTAPEV